MAATRAAVVGWLCGSSGGIFRRHAGVHGSNGITLTAAAEGSLRHGGFEPLWNGLAGNADHRCRAAGVSLRLPGQWGDPASIALGFTINAARDTHIPPGRIRAEESKHLAYGFGVGIDLVRRGAQLERRQYRTQLGCQIGCAFLTLPTVAGLAVNDPATHWSNPHDYD